MKQSGIVRKARSIGPSTSYRQLGTSHFVAEEWVRDVIFKPKRLPRKLKKRLEKLSCLRIYGRKRWTKKELLAVKYARKTSAWSREHSIFHMSSQRPLFLSSGFGLLTSGYVASSVTENGIRAIDHNQNSQQKDSSLPNSNNSTTK